MISTYQETLRSSRWRILKRRRIMRAEFRCEGCGRRYLGARVNGAMRVFQLHHRHYETVGHEGLEDVMILCSVCHRLEHGRIEAP